MGGVTPVFQQTGGDSSSCRLVRTLEGIKVFDLQCGPVLFFVHDAAVCVMI